MEQHGVKQTQSVLEYWRAILMTLIVYLVVFWAFKIANGNVIDETSALILAVLIGFDILGWRIERLGYYDDDER